MLDKQKIQTEPDANGYWGNFGGRWVPETLVAPLQELTDAFFHYCSDHEFQTEFKELLSSYVGRPTPLYHAKRLGDALGLKNVFLKREDLNHTGAHKINNCIGQILLAERMGKHRIIAETGAGQHGVATATVAARAGLECVIYMGQEDIRRQKLNVIRMRMLGADVRPVNTGTKTLKDAINEALRDWVANVNDTFYLLGSALGPHPYPLMVREFQSVIGKEVRVQSNEKLGKNPDILIACVGGGSNSIGLFHEFIQDENVRMIGIEAGGKSFYPGEHAARFAEGGSVGVLHGTRSYVLQNDSGQILETHSISAGLDYAAIGPEHAYLHDIGRIEYISAEDDSALEGFELLSKTEGIIPALESAHAIAGLIKLADGINKESFVVINLSGRGDKDVSTVADKLDYSTDGI
ncbi:MAG TPA: tryptophan synthase subunit beta [Pyrinomonadaceae bacterium]|nr:tryptophan synthase subunit beta [Pyrinomonadaceae bacterium]